MSKGVRSIVDRLKAGGWTLARHGKHEIWKHPNGATYPVSTTLSDRGTAVDNSLAAIERLEINPRWRRGAEVSVATISPEPESMQVRQALIASLTAKRWVKDDNRSGRLAEVYRLDGTEFSLSVPTKLTVPRMAQKLADQATQKEQKALAAKKKAEAPVPDPVPAMKWNDFICASRAKQDVSIKTVAELMSYKFPKLGTSTLNNVERGKRMFSREELVVWCEIMNLDPNTVPIPVTDDPRELARREVYGRPRKPENLSPAAMAVMAEMAERELKAASSPASLLTDIPVEPPTPEPKPHPKALEPAIKGFKPKGPIVVPELAEPMVVRAEPVALTFTEVPGTLPQGLTLTDKGQLTGRVKSHKSGLPEAVAKVHEAIEDFREEVRTEVLASLPATSKEEPAMTKQPATPVAELTPITVGDRIRLNRRLSLALSQVTSLADAEMAVELFESTLGVKG